MTSRLPKVGDVVVRTPKGFRCRLSQRLLHVEGGALNDVETAEGEGRRCPSTRRFPLSSLSETPACGDEALDGVETAEGEGRRCPNTEGFRCRLSQRSRHAEKRHSMTSRLPKV